MSTNTNPCDANPSGAQLLSVSELSQWLQVPPKTIYMWRYQGKGPTAIRVGRYLRFRRSDVEGWLRDQELGGGDGSSY